jgi:hypothetical protein
VPYSPVKHAARCPCLLLPGHGLRYGYYVVLGGSDEVARSCGIQRLYGIMKEASGRFRYRHRIAVGRSRSTCEERVHIGSL